MRLPLKFNDFTVTESDQKGPVLRAFVVGAKFTEGIKFSATRIVYRKGTESAKAYFEKFEKGEGISAKSEFISPLQIGERKALNLILKTATTVAYQRLVLLESDSLLMIVESPLIHDVVAKQFADEFFDSLVVVRK